MNSKKKTYRSKVKSRSNKSNWSRIEEGKKHTVTIHDVKDSRRRIPTNDPSSDKYRYVLIP